jgi:hypothetical protein
MHAWMMHVCTQVFVFDLAAAPSGSTDPIATYELPPLFTYHHINAFDRADGGVTVDVCGYATPDIITGAHAFCYVPNMQHATLRRKQVSSNTRFIPTLEHSPRPYTPTPYTLHPKLSHREPLVLLLPCASFSLFHPHSL